MKVGEEAAEPGSDVGEGEMVDQFETETYIPAQPEGVKKITWEGEDFEGCPEGMFDVPPLEIPAGEHRPVPGQGWIIPNPAPAVTIYTCSF